MAKEDILKKMLEDMKAEKVSEQQAIQKAIQNEMLKIEITEKHLSKDLITKIMAKQTTGTSSLPSIINVGTITPIQDDGTIVDDTFRNVVDDLLLKNNVYLYGKAGTGKTVLAKSVAEYLHNPNGAYRLGSGDAYYILNCSQWTSPIQIIGGFSIKGYEEGQLEKAWRNGGVLILDELPKLDPNTAGILNDALSMSADEGKTITNGKGDKIVKHKDFMVVGAGNTDMKSTSINFSGNNRQDYSLIDRFSGSMYEIGENTVLEKRLIYTAVYNICVGLRLQLPKDSVEAITLRSMLNFNRVYQLEMLRELDSPMATFYPVNTTKEQINDGTWKTDVGTGKTLAFALKSWTKTLGKQREDDMIRLAEFESITQKGVMLKYDQILEQATKQTSRKFEEDTLRIYGFDVKTGLNKAGKSFKDFK